MKTAAINKNDIFGASHRFDPSFHLSEGVGIKRCLSHSPLGLTTVSKLSSRIFYGLRANRVYVSKRDHAIPFLTGASIMQADLNNTKLVSKKYSPAIDEMTIKEGWVMITRSGTVGQTAWSNKLHAGKYGSEDIIRVVPSDSTKGGVLYAYLASKYGHSLLTQGSFGAVIKHIEPDFVGNLPIPNFPDSFQKEVDDLIQQSATLREQATAKLDEAKKIFENEIGVSNTDYGAYKNEGIAIQSIAGKFKRMDSQYQIGHKSIVKEKRNLTTTKINDVAKDIFTGNRGKRNYVENDGIYFLSSSEMMLANPKRFCKKISRRTPNLNDLLVKNGNILISRSGTVGNTILVSDDLNGCAVSEHAMRLVIDEEKIAPEYVFAYFCTKQGKDSLAILPYGSVIVTLGEEFLGDVDLPLLPIETQDRITALVKEYSKMTDMAIEKENKAITMVEEEIEKWQSPTA